MQEPDFSESSNCFIRISKSKKKKKKKKEAEEKLVADGTKRMIDEFHEKLKIATSRLLGKKARFPSFLVSASLNLFSMNRKGYEALLKTGSEPFLSVRQCQRYLASSKIRPGRHVDCYRQIVELRGENAPKVPVQISMDEKKIVLNLIWGPNGEIINFEQYDLGFKDFAEVLSHEATDAKIAKNINQWIATESGSNIVYILQYFPVSKACDGEELESQLLEVTNNCENINLNVYFIMCDGGGGNQALYKLLREKNLSKLKGKIPKQMIWLDEESISFPHPFIPGRVIYFGHCMSHNCKSWRNSIMSKAKDFQYINETAGSTITWDIGNYFKIILKPYINYFK